MNIWSYFTRRTDGRAAPLDLATWWSEREEAFVRRRREREQWRSQASLKGAATKRRAG